MTRAARTAALEAPPDCRTCGACCGPELDEGTHVDLFDVDVQRLSHAFREKHVVARGDGESSLATKRTRSSGTVCVALLGSVGRRVSCSIYERRPSACRDYVPGSPGCLESRRILEVET